MDSFSQDVCVCLGNAIKRDTGCDASLFPAFASQTLVGFFPPLFADVFVMHPHPRWKPRTGKTRSIKHRKVSPFSRNIFRVLVNMDFHRSMGIPRKNTLFVSLPCLGTISRVSCSNFDWWSFRFMSHKITLARSTWWGFFLGKIPCISNIEDETKNWCTCTCAFVHLEWFSIHFSTYLTFQVLRGDVFQKALPIIGKNWHAILKCLSPPKIIIYRYQPWQLKKNVQYLLWNMAILGIYVQFQGC